MATNIAVFASDGTVNPTWLQHITNQDATVSEITAYFLPGEKLRPEVKCCMNECVMMKRTGKTTPQATQEFNPMLLCFFCNRIYHTGCLDLDSHLIKEEKVPFQCNDCKRDLQNEACQAYFEKSAYDTKLIVRRAEFLLPTVEETEEQLAEELKFSQADKDSFNRRAKQILLEEDPEVAEYPNLITAYVLKQVMRARANKKRAAEISERFKAELDKTQAQLREANNKAAQLQASRLEESEVDPSHFHTPHSSTMVPPVSGNRARTVPPVSGPRATDVLSGLYTNGNTTASIETSQVPVNPPNAHAMHAEIPANESVTVNEENISQNSTQSQVNTTDFTTLLQRLTVSQERDEQRNLESIRRRALPKIVEFKGEENQWLAFKQDVDRYREHLGRDEVALKYHVKSALKGEAFEIVRDLFDAESLDVIMSTLKIAYGDEMRMVRNRGEELKNFKFQSNLYRMDAIKLQAAIQAYFASCKYANIGYINTNVIAEAIFSQFNQEDRLRCRDFYVQRNPNAATIVMDVQTIYDYLLKRIPLLDDTPIKKKANEPDVKAKSKAYQVHNMTVSNLTNQNKGDYKFEIKDKINAPYIGYDLDKVALTPKSCAFCNSNEHFSLQCPRFKDKNENERVKWISDKGLCRNCVITTAHTATNCDLKNNCGYKVDKNSRCSARHHIAIHEASNNSQQSNRNNSFKKRRTNTRNNTARANERINNARVQNDNTNKETTANTGAAFKLSYKVNVGAVTDSKNADEPPKTVKVFRVKLWGPAGYVVALVIGDSGSEITLMREDLREALKLQGSAHTLHLQWADKTTRTSNATQLNMKIQSMEDNAAKIDLNNCFALDELFLPQRTLDMNALRAQFPHLKNIPFEGYFNEYPVMLIGAPHAYLIEGCELVEGGNNGPIAVKTKIGWSVYGGMNHSLLNAVRTSEIHTLTEATVETEDPIEDLAPTEEKISNHALHELLVGHFSVESLGIRATQTHLTEDEKNAVELLDEEVKVLESGFIEAPLVWRRKDKVIPRLPNNYPAVLRRQLAEERKLRKNPLHLEAYNNNFKELIKLNYIREATEEDMRGEWPNVWYLPTSLVVNTNKNPPKMRNVYDASATYQGTSLNHNLLKGPDMLVNIVHVLIHMRKNSIAFTGDVQAMFNMVKMVTRDQQCQRLLFREDPESPMKTFIATVMLFGPTSSPFTSQYVKNKTAEKWMDKYPEAARTLIECTYMDDVLTSEPTLEKAVQIAKQLIEICDSINWKLIAFQSNSMELLKSLPSAAVKQEAISILESEAETQVTKILGCQWNPKKDCFEFKLENNLFIKLVKDFDEKPTKRDQASTLARIYDVLGLISHFTIRGKILLQRSWEAKLDWDDTISDKAAKEWKAWLGQINDISKLEFPRRFTQLDALNDAENIHLHIFADAGKEAFGAVAYLVTKSKDVVDSTIVMAKAKVTPLRLKTETAVKEMPRLELTAALIAARLSKTITDALKIENLQRSFWCDSEVVLRWILNPNQKLIKYAISPVEEILELTERNEWNYVPTELNIADLCTKMKKFDFASNNSIWMHGPEFIKLNQEFWPKNPIKLIADDCDVINNIYIRKLNYSTHVLPPINCKWANDECLDRFRASIKATWTKTKRATARALKLFMDIFIPLVRRKQLSNIPLLKEIGDMTENLTNLTASDFERAEHFIFRKIQREEFPVEYKALSAGKEIKNPMMQQLNVFMDPQGLIRINARANANKETFPQQFAPLLPRRNVLVMNLLASYHYKHNHVGMEAQIAEIRTIAWIPELRMALRSVKARCNWCKVKQALPYSPKMAPLPIDRTNTDMKPFEVTGIDILGPLRPTVNGNTKKVYILIFVCALTRYIHLHILDSMESLRILEGIVVFWSSYGPVRKFISDNAANFKRTEKTLREDYLTEQVLSEQLSILGPKLAEIYRVEWQFIPAYSPWFGGVYERLIKEVKRAIATTLEKRKVSRVELNIAIMEAAHRINCRPLTENPLEAADAEVLTPHHLVKNKSGWPLLPGVHKNVYSTIPDRSIYKKGRELADELMRKFTAYYLPVLTKRTKWHKSEPTPKVGDLVLMIEPNKTRRQWSRARIIKIHFGKDGTARVADIRLSDGTIRKSRALRNLARLDLSKGIGDDEHEKPGNTNVNVGAITLNATVNSDLNLIQSSKFELPFEVNFTAYFICLRHSRPYKINHFNMKKAIIAENACTKAIQIDNISVDMKLSEIISALEPEFQSIFSAFRVRDYRAKEDLDTVYIILMDKLEYVKAVKNFRTLNFNPMLHVSFPNVSLGSAFLKQSLEVIDAAAIMSLPIPLAIFDLPRFKGNTSTYVAKIFQTFESVTDIKGFRWCVEKERFITRSFGFITVTSREEAMRLMGNSFEVGNTRVNAKLTDSATILLHKVDDHLINARHKAILTPIVSDANLLNVNRRQNISITVSQDVEPNPNPVKTKPRLKSEIVVPKRSNVNKQVVTLDQLSAAINDVTEVANLPLDEDSLVITLDTNSFEIDPNEPCCSKSIAMREKTKQTVDDSLRLRPTKALMEPPAAKKSKQQLKSESSDYVIIRMDGIYPRFSEFLSSIVKYVRNFTWILFRECSLSSTAYIKFDNSKQAIKFKELMEGLNHQGKCLVTYSHNTAKRVLGEAIEKKLKPVAAGEVMYLVNAQKQVLQCRYKEDWNQVSFPAPIYIGDQVASESTNE